MAISKTYHPQEVEDKWYRSWQEKGFFRSKPNPRKEPYTVVIPPPNVTGVLHMGHMLNNTIQDVLIRRARMLGKEALWVAGTDHASIATEAKVVAMLKEKGINKADISREEFMKHAWEWKEKYGGIILEQLKKLGASCDWERTRFTMEDDLTDAVLKVFVDLYRKGHIYRGVRMVNWDPAGKTALSDEEVIHKQVNSKLYFINYQIVEPTTNGQTDYQQHANTQYITIATTRPETILGDTAVCMNPNDARYQHLKGKQVLVPLINRPIPIIFDEYVDMEFGTGCLKVTPAHDLNDYELGQKHNLPSIDIISDDGTMNSKAQLYVGEDRFVVRKKIAKELEAKGQLVKTEDITNNVGFSERTDAVIEPKLSMQWFLKMENLRDPALNVVMEDIIKLHPPKFKNMYRSWMENIRDWCISRQLWWGHQIPAWYAVSETDGQICDETPFVVAQSEVEARQELISQFGSNVKVEQDPDVLDTWFSSGLWPFSTLGWPDETKDLEFYYPTSTLVTGFDIIFFWVARMTMMAGHFTGQMPFKDVYIHGLVLDENGKKMSKSANNGINPLVLIKKYGTDALRYTLVKEVAGAGQDIRLEYNRKTDESASVEASRNFANKLWNAARFVMMNLDGQTPQQLGQPHREAQELSDRWILSRYYQVVRQTSDYIDDYGLGEAAKGLYDFIWGDFCDWYIELVKSRLQKDSPVASRSVAQQTLAYVLEGILKLLHPFMPHITEEIWHTLTQSSEELSLALQSYPEADTKLIDLDLEQQFELLIGTIRTVRNLRAEADIKPGVKVTAILQNEQPSVREILTTGQSYIQDLAKVESLTITHSLDTEIEPAIAGVMGTVQVLIPLAGVVDVAALRAKLEKSLSKAEAEAKSLSGRLGNSNFVDKAPPEVVEAARDTLQEAELQAEILRARLQQLA